MDDRAAVGGDRELARPDLSRLPIDLDLGDDRDPRAVALRVSNAAAGHFVAGLVAPRRGPRLPGGFLRHRLEDGDVARVLDMAQAELYRIEIQRRRHLVDEGFAGEVDLRPDRIAQMRAAQGRGAVEQGRDRLPGGALVGELVSLRRPAEPV